MTPQQARRFGPRYREKITLADGTRVLLRLVQPQDADILVEAFQRLSDESRYIRFFGVKSSLPAREVEYLTHIDGQNHFALGATLVRDGQTEGAGVARFIRLRDDPEAAEPAITVLDHLQGKGLGRILLERLIAAARERNVRRFRFEVLPQNARMLDLVHDVAPAAVEKYDASSVRVDVPLAADSANHASETRRHPVLHRALSSAAKLVFRSDA